MQLLGHESDPGSGGAVVGDVVVAVGNHGPLRRRDDPADDMDQGRLPGAIRAQECEDLALADLQVNVLERLQAGGVCLGEV